MKKVAFAILGVIAIAIAIAWLFLAMDYSDHVVVGTYVMTYKEQTCILTLKADHSFHQERMQVGKSLVADGEWRRVGEGGLAFSKQFLIMPGQEPGADGTSYANIHKALGLFPSIVLTEVKTPSVGVASYYVLSYRRTQPATGTDIIGSYAGDEPGVTTQLTVNADHTFKQSWSKEGSKKEAVGMWETTETGYVHFSKDFLTTSGASLGELESASALNWKGPNLKIVIAMDSIPPMPVFRRKTFWF
jgi:hypothetical protein